MSSASSAPADSTMAVDSTALPPVPPVNVSVTQPSQPATQALPPPDWSGIMLIVEELVGGGKAGDTAFKDALKALMTFWGVESWDDLAVFSSNDLADAITGAPDIDEFRNPDSSQALGLPTGLCPLWKTVLPRHYHAGNHQIS